MSENIHDKGYKRILSNKKNFLNLLQSFVPELWRDDITENDLELIDKEFILKDFREKESDIIYKLSYKNEEIIFYCLLELQSSVDFTMPFRLLEYMFELHRRLFLEKDEKIRERSDYRVPPVIPIVLYNGEHEWTAVRSFREYTKEHEYLSAYSKKLIDFEYILLNVNKYDDETLVEIDSLMSLIFLFDKKSSSKDYSSELAEAKNKIAKVKNTVNNLSNDERISLYYWMENVLFHKIKNKEMFKGIINALEKGEDIDMTYALEGVYDKIKEEGIQEGKEEGKDEGIQIGIQEKAIKIARTLFKKGYSIDEISEITELDYKTIKELKEQME